MPATGDIRRLSHPFYRALERLLQAEGLDAFAEAACRAFYAPTRGRPSIPPGVYSRMLLVGYMDGIGSERGIAWRCADSISLREFLGYGLSKNPPDHSSVSRTRRRLSVEAHEAVFARVFERRRPGAPTGGASGRDACTHHKRRCTERRSAVSHQRCALGQPRILLRIAQAALVHRRPDGSAARRERIDRLWEDTRNLEPPVAMDLFDRQPNASRYPARSSRWIVPISNFEA